MRHLDLFSGIGGFAFATEAVWPDTEHIFCDNDEFCREVLKKHWPEAEIHGDIRTLRNTESNVVGETVTKVLGEQRSDAKDGRGVYLLTGGFPCQPFSNAGRKRGKEDDRHLWPEMLRVIQEFRPHWVVGENVAGIVNMVLDEVCTDLENEGYEVQPFVIPACAVNAPHRRDRVWIVANRTGEGQQELKQQSHTSHRTEDETRVDHRSERPHSYASNTSFERLQRRRHQAKGQHGQPRRNGSDQRPNWKENWVEVATRLCRVDDGLPRRLDRNPRLKALGNAIVPQVAVEIFKAIKEVDAAA